MAAGSGLAFADAAKAPVKADQKPTRTSYGKAMTNAAAVPVSDVIAQSDKYEGKTVKMTGLVTQVCQAKGCWFEVAPSKEARGVRIKSADYSIFVPFDSAGRTAVVEGTLIAKTLTKDQAQHFADDAAKASGKPAEAVVGPQKEFQIAATGVELH